MTLCSFMDFMAKYWFWFVLLIPYTLFAMWLGAHLTVKEFQRQLADIRPVGKILSYEEIEELDS